jgi:L-seryl-tRNA(Ser) seleniumtransferase
VSKSRAAGGGRSSDADRRRALPSVNALLEREPIRALLAHAPRTVVVDAVRATIEQARTSDVSVPRDDREWAAAVSAAVERAQRSSLRHVINATGVVLHTNLGRAPLPAAAVSAMQRAANGYTNLEYDIEKGARGSRYSHCVALLCELTGAEDALVVNNNAAAVVLTLNTLALGRRVAVSRGELIEIGGSFRIPEIMERSGVQLLELGTTNRTHLSDYEKALSQDVAAVIKVHRSNFAMQGFVAEVDAPALAALLASRGIPLVHDLGSGLLMSLEDLGLTGEPTAAEAIRDGSTVVTMSGDKLLGGPQSGLIVGRRDVIARLRENPLARALRVDKLTIAALEATLALYRDPATALREIPVLAMLGLSVAALRPRADALRARIGVAAVVADVESSVGGGAFPDARVPSVALAFARGAERLEEKLRLGDPAVVGRIADGTLLLDLRTVQPDEDDGLVEAVRAALAT